MLPCTPERPVISFMMNKASGSPTSPMWLRKASQGIHRVVRWGPDAARMLRQRRTIWLSGSLLALLALAPLAIYVYHFHHLPISSNPIEWGNFGDFIGGVMNPILALVGIFITLSVTVVSEQRNQTEVYNMERAIRPLARLELIDTPERIEIRIRNAGLGPMTIADVRISSAEQPNMPPGRNFLEVLPERPAAWLLDDVSLHPTGVVVEQGQALVLFHVTGSPEQPAWLAYRKPLRQALSGLYMEVDYLDLYERSMRPLSRRLSWFGRNETLAR